MIDTFAQIPDEDYWSLMATVSLPAKLHLETIKELVEEYEEGLKAELISEEVSVC